jgi:hypothetical protein
MTVLRWNQFLGENRALNPKLLPAGVGTVSRNHKPGRGDLRPWREPVTVANVPSGRNTIYRMGRDVASDALYWLSWTGVVHAVRGFDPDDTTERTYYTGDGAPKVTDNVIGLAAPPYPTTSRPLGVPAPLLAPIITAGVPGTEEVGNYFYVYTFVTDWGWESAPSPVSNDLETQGDTPITVTNFSAPPAGNYNINRMRIYRTEAGSETSSFFFVAEIPIGSTNYVDDKTHLAEELPTSTWTTPPADLTNLCALWNGMLAGISGNSVRFCEAYTPYAWPIQYDVVPPDSKPVALGIFGQTMLVLTTGRPVVVAGSSPDAMDQRMLEMSQACIAPRSTVSMGYGVVWASNDGLCFYGADGPRVLTAGIMLREDWQALRPNTIIGEMYEGLYFGSYDDGTGRKGFFIDPSSAGGGMYFLDVGYPATHFDELQDQLYVLEGTAVRKFDAGLLMTTRARSSVTRLPKPMTSFAAAEVAADAYPVTLRVWADGALKHEQAVQSSTPIRLPSGFIAQEWQAEVETMNAVQSVALAHSVEELKQV